jgi:hypothetical protein
MAPFEEDKKGNKYVIAIVDMFSRFTCLYAVNDITAKIVVEEALIPHMGIFGVPLELLSENGTQFVNDLIEEFSSLAGMEHIVTTPYSHQENSLVERTHRESLRHIRGFLYDENSKLQWNRCLPLIQRILNSAQLQSIGCSASQLVFANAVDTDRGIFIEFDKAEQKQMEISEYYAELIAQQAYLIDKAQKLLLQHDIQHSTTQTAKTPITEYATGSFVLLTRYTFGPKLDPVKLGPFRVVSSSGSTYVIENLINHKTKWIHVKYLQPFVYNPQTTNPEEVALHDDNSYFVEEILDYKGSKSRKNTLMFKVRWQGYSEEADTWEPWKNLRSNYQLHKFLASPFNS